MTPGDTKVIWTDLLRYRARTRGFNLALIQPLLRSASEHSLIRWRRAGW